MISNNFKVIDIKPMEGKDNVVSITVSQNTYTAVVPKDFVKLGDSVDFIKAGQIVDATHPRFDFLKSEKIQYQVESRVYDNVIVDGIVLEKLKPKSIEKLFRVRSKHTYDSTLKVFSDCNPNHYLPYFMTKLDIGYMVFYTYQKIARKLNPSIYILDIYKKGKKLSNKEIIELNLEYPIFSEAVTALNTK